MWALLASGSTGGIAYWLSCYPLGDKSPLNASSSPCSWDTDFVKSRVQLRATPPTGTPVKYIAREVKTILAESGL